MSKLLRFIFISILLISFLSVLVYANHSNSYTFTFYYSNREITIESAHADEEEAQIIADYIAYGITPAGYIESQGAKSSPLVCILFGHSIETYTAKETIHNVYTTSPKCVLNFYEVEICTRESCDYIQKTLINSTRISYCHG